MAPILQTSKDQIRTSRRFAVRVLGFEGSGSLGLRGWGLGFEGSGFESLGLGFRVLGFAGLG